jgi:hypothetical protein
MRTIEVITMDDKASNDLAKQAALDNYYTKLGVLVVASLIFFGSGYKMFGHYFDSLIFELGPFTLQCLVYSVLVIACRFIHVFTSEDLAHIVALPFVLAINCGFGYTVFVFLAVKDTIGSYVVALCSTLLMAVATLVYNHQLYGHLTAIAVLGFMGVEMHYKTYTQSFDLTPNQLLWLNVVIGIPIMLTSDALSNSKNTRVSNFGKGFGSISGLNYFTSILCLSSFYYWGEVTNSWVWAHILFILDIVLTLGATSPANRSPLSKSVARIFYTFYTIQVLCDLLMYGPVVRDWMIFIGSGLVMVVVVGFLGGFRGVTKKQANIEQKQQ